MRPLALALVLAAACSSSTGGPAPAPQGCLNDELRQDDGSCLAPGVAPAACAAGFAYDGKGGCTPVLPPMPCGEGTLAVPGDTACAPVGPGEPPKCARGQLAVPGESACHEIAPCGASPYAGIPVDSTTQYVDGSYSGTDSDGSLAKPWRTIGAAITASAPGAIVAVAAGTYAERVVITGHPVKLWGRCPSMVEIAAPAGSNASLVVGSSAAGSEVHAIATSGPGLGIAIDPGSARTLVDRVWIHDVGGYGFQGFAPYALKGSLVENATTAAIATLALGATSSIEATVVRGTQPSPIQQTNGIGVVVERGTKVTIHGTVIEAGHEAGVSIRDATASLDTVVIRDIDSDLGRKDFGMGIVVSATNVGAHLSVAHALIQKVRSAGIRAIGKTTFDLDDVLIRDVDVRAIDRQAGFGIEMDIFAPNNLTPATGTVRRSLIERTHAAGIFVGPGTLTVDQSSTRDTAPDSFPGSGVGIHAQSDTAGTVASQLTVTQSLVERAVNAGIDVESSTATITGCVVRDIAEASPQVGGLGIQALDATAIRPSVTVIGCVLSGNHGGGIGLQGADGDIESTVVRDNHGPTIPAGSAGIGAQPGMHGPATLTVSGCLVTGNVSSGILVIGATATISSTSITGTASTSGGELGDGLSLRDGAQAQLSTLHIDGNARAGMSVFGASATLAATRIGCQPIALDREDGSDGTSGSYALDPTVQCACGAPSDRCQVLSSGLSPPEPLKLK